MSRTFNGTNESLNTSAPVTAYPFTIAFWFKVTAIGNYQAMLDLSDAADSSQIMVMVAGSAASPAGGLFALVSNNVGGESTVISGSGVTAGAWQHAAFVGISATSRRLHLNGAAGVTSTDNITPVSLDRLYLGLRSNSTEGFAGAISHLAMWNVALSADEIAMLSASRMSPLLVRPTSRVFYTPYLGRDSTDIDIVGRRSLTVTGAVSSRDEPALQAAC